MTDGTWNRKGVFTFPSNIRSLIDWFLDPDLRVSSDDDSLNCWLAQQARHLRRARQRVVNRIENSAMTGTAKAFGKALAGVQALQKQAQRDKRRKRQQRARR